MTLAAATSVHTLTRLTIDQGTYVGKARHEARQTYMPHMRIKESLQMVIRGIM